MSVETKMKRDINSKRKSVVLRLRLLRYIDIISIIHFGLTSGVACMSKRT